jgi:hypothetical protein
LIGVEQKSRFEAVRTVLTRFGHCPAHFAASP